MRTGRVTEVEPSEDRVGEVEHADAQAVPTIRLHVLDETQPRERPELPRDRAGADAGAPGDTGRPCLPAVGERIEDRNRANGSLDVALGWLTGAWHEASLSP